MDLQLRVRDPLYLDIKPLNLSVSCSYFNSVSLIIKYQFLISCFWIFIKCRGDMNQSPFVEFFYFNV